MAEIESHSHQNGAELLSTLELDRSDSWPISQFAPQSDLGGVIKFTLTPAAESSVNCLRVRCDMGTRTGIALVPTSHKCEPGLKLNQYYLPQLKHSSTKLNYILIIQWMLWYFLVKPWKVNGCIFQLPNGLHWLLKVSAKKCPLLMKCMAICHNTAIATSSIKKNVKHIFVSIFMADSSQEVWVQCWREWIAFFHITDICSVVNEMFKRLAWNLGAANST